MAKKIEKASLVELYKLHKAVTDKLTDEVKDGNCISQAITFLKNNEITVDFVENDETLTLVNSLKKVVAEGTKTTSIEDMLAEYKDSE